MAKIVQLFKKSQISGYAFEGGRTHVVSTTLPAWSSYSWGLRRIYLLMHDGFEFEIEKYVTECDNKEMSEWTTAEIEVMDKKCDILI